MTSKLKYLIGILITFIIGLVAVFLLLLKSQYYNNTLKLYELGTAEQCGYVGVELVYDNEPVDVELISPSGKHYNKQTVSIYNINTDKRTITVLYDTSELGEWVVSFNEKTNERITYSFINKPSPTLNVTDVNLVKIEDYYYVKFTPVMESDIYKTCKFTITLSSNNCSFLLDDGNVKLNETTYILFNPKETAYNGDMYSIKIAIQTQDEQQSITKSIQIQLEDKLSK